MRRDEREDEGFKRVCRTARRELGIVLEHGEDGRWCVSPITLAKSAEPA